MSVLRPTAVLLLAVLAAAADPAATVEVEAKLLAKSPTPNAKDLKTYSEGFATYQYEVVKVTKGTLAAKRILVAHWAVMRNIEQPITRTAIGATISLALAPFEALPQGKDYFRSDTTNDTASPLFMQVAQQLEMPAESKGRWDYGVTISRVMRSYHLLREQLKLVVIGDCQGWFGARMRLYFPEENQKTPVALALTCERTCLSFYETLVDNYVVKAPRLEWVVVPWQTRWVNGTAKWAGYGTYNETFKKSPGFLHDQQHAAAVFANRNPAPITLEKVLADSGAGPAWRKAPWGELTGGDRGDNLAPWTPQGPKAISYKFPDQAPAQFSEERWAQWERIVTTLAERRIRMLTYIIPFRADPGKPKLDKADTSDECYLWQVKRMQELEAKHKGLFFFWDFNNRGDNGLTPADNPLDHPSGSGAVKLSTEMNAYIHELMKKHNIPTKPVGAP